MAEGRTKTFSSGKVIVLSSPSFLETSLIWREYEKGTQKKYHVPCLHCNELQVLQLAHLYYDRENKRVCYTCAACGVLIDEAEKAEMIRRGKWVAARPQMTGIHESYQYSGLVSPFETWAKVFRMYLEAARQAKKGDFKALQAFKNLTMGEPFKKPVGRILQGLERRIQEKRESYNLASLPKGVNTCFVDVQANRLESSVYHYAPDDTAWLLEHKVLKGDTMLAGVWEDLFEYMKATPIHGMGLDAGYQATHVINKVRELLGKVRQHRIRWIWPLHGKGTPFGQPAKDLWSRRVEPGRLVVTNVDSGKDLIMARAAMDITLPGALHFPTWLSKAQVQQLCAERPVTIEDQITKSQWVKRKGYDRNEMLDCAVGCLAIWQGLQLLIPGLRQRLRSTKSKRAQPAMRKQTWL
jgi:phage terminase large subunit GpA-like protein